MDKLKNGDEWISWSGAFICDYQQRSYGSTHCWGRGPHTQRQTHTWGLRTTLAFITHHSLFHPLQCHSLTLLCAPALAVSTSWAMCSSMKEGGCMQAHIHTTGVRRSSQATSLLFLECRGPFSLFFSHIFFLVFLPTRLFCHLWDQVDLQNQEPGSFHCTNPVGTNLWILTATVLSQRMLGSRASGKVAVCDVCVCVLQMGGKKTDDYKAINSRLSEHDCTLTEIQVLSGDT